MSGVYLDPEHRPRVLAFIHDQFGFLSVADLEEAEAKVDAAEAGKNAQVLFELARSLAKKTWASRRAFREYVEGVGCEEEWRLTVAAVSKSTGHLLARFRHGTACESLEATLAHDEAESAFRVQEREEITEVLRHVHEALWQAQRETLLPRIEEAEAVFEATMARIETLRELAVDTPWIEGEVLSKVAGFEDVFLFEGAPQSLEKLDAEIAYYQEQKALPVV